MGDQVKVIYEKTINGVTRLISATTAAGDQGLRVKQLVGAGNPFWAWPSVPPGKIIAADFTDAPICSNDVSENNTAIGNITIDPTAVLTYE